MNLTDITPEEVLRGFLGRKILGRRVRSGWRECEEVLELTLLKMGSCRSVEEFRELT
ncbi:MAG: hypothetical protein QXY99_08065 [Thermoproteota archaeon]